MKPAKRIRFITVMLLLMAAVVLTACTSTNPLGESNAPVTLNGQSVKLFSGDGGQYSPKEIRVKIGSTVRIEGDPETLVGGMDTVVIEDYGVRKKIAPGDNIIEFVANKPGSFEIICANGMGNGKLIVEPQ